MKPGDEVFQVRLPGSTREAIALFSAATADPNPIHIDDAFAADCGFAQVIQQGPMSTAHFARLLADRFGAAALRTLDVAFVAPVFPLEPLSFSATVVEAGELLRIELRATKDDGTVTARGIAEVAP